MAVNKSANEALNFEHYVLELLRAEAVQQSKVLLSGPETGADFDFVDAVAPSGFYEVPGPCLIEIKLQLNRDFLGNFVRKAYLSNPEFGGFIFVTQRSSKSDIERYTNFLRKEFSNLVFKILSKEDLVNLAKQHPDAALAFKNEFLDEAIGIFQVRDEKKLFEQHLSALRFAYAEDRLALFLGAGVSKSANLPDWAELLKRLSIELFRTNVKLSLDGESENEIYEYFHSETPTSPIIAARLLRDSFGDSFAERVRHALYANVPEFELSELVRELGALCMPQRDRMGLAAVVNYNFDNVLETELDNRQVRYRVVLSDRDDPLRFELPVYHVHGYLPRGGSITELHKQALVLSEEAYHSQFIDPYLWANIIQLNLLRSNVCLFVGLSMTDPNLRRLLEITHSKKSGVRHYAVMRDHWAGKKATKLSEPVQSLPKVFKGLEEASLAKLGVSVIWVKDFPEVPQVISKIRN